MEGDPRLDLAFAHVFEGLSPEEYTNRFVSKYQRRTLSEAVIDIITGLRLYNIYPDDQSLKPYLANLFARVSDFRETWSEHVRLIYGIVFVQDE